MSAKLYKILVTAVGVLAAVINALIVLFDLHYAPALVGGVTILATVIDDIMAGFITIKDDTAEEGT